MWDSGSKGYWSYLFKSWKSNLKAQYTEPDR